MSERPITFAKTGEGTRESAERQLPQQYEVGDLVVLTDPEGIGVDTDTVWRVSGVHSVGTVDAYADLVGHAYPQMTTASRFSRLAPAPQCTRSVWSMVKAHEFTTEPRVATREAGPPCGELRTSSVHNTDRARAERTIHAARDHEGVPSGPPYAGEWPGTTVIAERPPLRVKDLVKPVGRDSGMAWHVTAVDGDRVQIDLVRGSLLGPQWEKRSDVELVSRPAPADLDDDKAWSGYVATLPPSTAEERAELAVEVSTWTAQRRASVDAFREAARLLWSLRADGMARPGSHEYRGLRDSMRTFRELIALCDRQNDALRRELTR